MNRRIEEVRKAEGLTQDEFAKRLGMSRSFINQVAVGKREVSDRTISDICREFEIREEWLRTGNGPMKEEKPRDIALAAELEKVITAGSDDFRKALIAWLVRMPPEHWTALQTITLDLLKDVRNLLDAADAAQSTANEPETPDNPDKPE